MSIFLSCLYVVTEILLFSLSQFFLLWYKHQLNIPWSKHIYLLKCIKSFFIWYKIHKKQGKIYIYKCVYKAYPFIILQVVKYNMKKYV